MSETIKSYRPFMPDTLCLRPISFPDITIEKYPGSRFWAVWVHGELLAVTVYKKGAEAVKSALLQLA